MEKGGGGLSHLTPLERAIEYIETHLDENIDLGDVSREMGYSYYHMTRMFSAVLGEPVGRYISRRRLYRAARQLVSSDRRIIDIALESGFQSPEAFSRAFKAAFKTTPADYPRNYQGQFLLGNKFGEGRDVFVQALDGAGQTRRSVYA